MSHRSSVDSYLLTISFIMMLDVGPNVAINFIDFILSRLYTSKSIYISPHIAIAVK